MIFKCAIIVINIKKPSIYVDDFLAADEGFDEIKVLPPSRPAAGNSPPDWQGICKGWFPRLHRTKGPLV